MNQGTDCYEKVKDLFGCVQADGSIDRKQLGDIIFHDINKKRQLEDIVHPYVINELKKGIEICDDQFIFLDIPLLFETHLESLCDKIIVVYVNQEIQTQRLMDRNHISQEDALHLIHQQISTEKKVEMGDYLIDNTLNLENLYQNIEKVLEVLKDETIYE